MKKLTVKLTKARDTKGTYVYKDDAADAPIRSLYITKGAIEGDAPETITLTLEGK